MRTAGSLGLVRVEQRTERCAFARKRKHSQERSERVGARQQERGFNLAAAPEDPAGRKKKNAKGSSKNSTPPPQKSQTGRQQNGCALKSRDETRVEWYSVRPYEILEEGDCEMRYYATCSRGRKGCQTIRPGRISRRSTKKALEKKRNNVG